MISTRIKRDLAGWYGQITTRTGKTLYGTGYFDSEEKAKAAINRWIDENRPETTYRHQ